MKNTVTEICCGLGGTRAALEAAGFKVIQSIDIDDVACKFHSEFWGDSECKDITNTPLNEIKKADILSAGFPCQPFSTSGYRTGFLHEQGNVFSSLLQLIDNKKYKAVFLENVTGLLSNEKGQTFRIILKELSLRYQHVEWITLNLTDLGIPQNRPRVIIIGHNQKKHILGDLIDQYYHVEQHDLFGTTLSSNLEEVESRAETNERFGIITDTNDLNLKGTKKDIKFQWDLMEILFKKKIGDFKVYSGRFWGRTGKTTFYISENQYSHSIGTSMGAAPTFAIHPEFATDEIKEKIGLISNWTSIHSDFFVFRLKPGECLKLFGDLAENFSDKIEEFKAPLNQKYKLIGNMFAPDQALPALIALFRAFND